MFFNSTMPIFNHAVRLSVFKPPTQNEKEQNSICALSPSSHKPLAWLDVMLLQYSWWKLVQLLSGNCLYLARFHMHTVQSLNSLIIEKLNWSLNPRNRSELKIIPLELTKTASNPSQACTLGSRSSTELVHSCSRLLQTPMIREVLFLSGRA